MNHAVDILLATYRGAAYLDQQLASLAQQTLRPARLLVADDGSDDDTVACVERFRAHAPFPVEIIARQRVGGPRANFARLFAASTAPCVALCDQDDVWDADKLAVSVGHLHALEARHGAQVPLCVHGDLRVIAADGQLLRPSLHAWRGIEPGRDHHFRRLLYRSVLWGCTIVANRALIRAAMPIPEQAVMHDWWLALVAAGFGHMAYDRQARISYRFHGTNVTETGTMPDGWHQQSSYIWSRLQRRGRNLEALRLQAQSFAERFAHLPDHPAVRAARRCAGHRNLGPVARRLDMLRGGYIAPSLSRIVASLLIA